MTLITFSHTALRAIKKPQMMLLNLLSSDASHHIHPYALLALFEVDKVKTMIQGFSQ